MPEIPIWKVLSGAEEVALEAAHRLLSIAEEALHHRRVLRIVLAGGSTPKRLYEILAGAPCRSRLPWGQVHFFWGDERAGGPDHPDSNYHMAQKAMLEKLNIPEGNLHRMHGEASDPDAAARQYEGQIRHHFGLGPDSPPPSFDLVLLGMGADGHTASLFPETPALGETNRWVAANPVPKLGTHRLTLTPVLLNQAAWVIFLVVGADKAKTLAEVLLGPHEPQRLPSQLIDPSGGQRLWLLDEAASACLPPARKE